MVPGFGFYACKGNFLNNCRMLNNNKMRITDNSADNGGWILINTFNFAKVVNALKTA